MSDNIRFKTMLAKEKLTTLRFCFDWRRNEIAVFASQEWAPSLDWTNYNKTFTLSSLFYSDIKTYNDRETRELIERYNLIGKLNQIEELLRKGKHQYTTWYYNQDLDILVMDNVHSDVLGLNNKSSCLRAGGIRRHEATEDEIEVLIDGLNLSRGMSFKNFAAGIPYGGNKFCVMMKPLNLEHNGELGFLAYAIDRSRNFSGPDMKFPPEMAEVLNERYTINIGGAPNSTIGPSGTPTAHGVFQAIREAIHFVFQTKDLTGKSILVQGLGAVGRPLAKLAIKAKMTLFVCDINSASIEQLQNENPMVIITEIAVDKMLTTEVDVLSPCAIGGIFTFDNIDTLKCKIIIGGANNQLKASGYEEEKDLAEKLANRGILFQVAWWHNIGGVYGAIKEYEQGEKINLQIIIDQIESQVKNMTRRNLAEAREKGITPTENAYLSAIETIYPH